ncbi:MAG: class I SAM-dependent methyltransferase [candidate division Zixibacteria bacterium]|nr:class I SAM-dependent methyltransferase [candidate division Zixibacteria bacterium]
MNGKFKTFLKSRLPFLVPLWRRIKFFSFSGTSPQQRFTRIFRRNTWGDADSISGTGSSLIQTEAVRQVLPSLVRELNCRSLLDIPCGDFFWMKSVGLDVEYIGGDIVDELIGNNQRRYGGEGRRFMHLDLLQDTLPEVDLILCRDCLVHFSYKHIFQALRNIKRSGIRYLLTTTFVERDRNEDIPTGGWRPVNLQRPPFNFPAPMELIDEQCPDDGYRDKHLGLWKTADIPIFPDVLSP